MKILFIAACLAAFVFVPQQWLALSPNGSLYQHFTYVFAHNGIGHMVVNLLTFSALFNLLVKIVPPLELFLVAFAAAVGASWVVAYDVPLMGASAMVYALLGIWGRLIMAKRIAFADKFQLYLAVFSVVVFSVIGIVKHNSAGALHMVAMIVGFAYAFTKFRLLILNSK